VTPTRNDRHTETTADKSNQCADDMLHSATMVMSADLCAQENLSLAAYVTLHTTTQLVQG